MFCIHVLTHNPCTNKFSGIFVGYDYNFLEFFCIVFRYNIYIYVPAGTRYPTGTARVQFFTRGYGQGQVFIIPDQLPSILWMESRCHVQLGAHKPHELAPERLSEHWVSVGDDELWNAMEANNVSEEGLRHRLHRVE
jgi:hypothetical protein